MTLDLARLADLGTATVSDALDRLGLPGSAHGIAPLANGLRMAGPAYTVRYVPAGDPKGTVGDYVDDVPPGGIVVLDNQGRTDATVWGDILTEFDDEAHLEARDAGGLRLYFKGVPDEARRCLSLCLWDSAEQAHGALRLPRHQAAVRIAHSMYERFTLERHVVARDPGTRRIRISPV